jgi:hypothetical protein
MFCFASLYRLEAFYMTLKLRKTRYSICLRLFADKENTNDFFNSTLNRKVSSSY